MKNNNLIPSLLIACGLFAVAFKPAPQPAPIPQAEPVAVTAASVTTTSNPVIVWYGTSNGTGTDSSSWAGHYHLLRAWSDGTIEAKRVKVQSNSQGCTAPDFCEWFEISPPQVQYSMACKSDVSRNGSVDFDDLLQVLEQWGNDATCPEQVQLQCGLGLPNG